MGDSLLLCSSITAVIALKASLNRSYILLVIFLTKCQTASCHRVVHVTQKAAMQKNFDHYMQENTRLIIYTQ